jgi:putative FmdB family regulatory protein
MLRQPCDAPQCKPYNLQLCAARPPQAENSPEKSSSTMPIYAYKCESCGFAKDVLQKMSDTPLSVCPQCGASSFKKQLTAAGFQLKGSGWYVTDFRGGNSGAPAPKSADTSSAAPDNAGSKSADTAASSPSSGGSSAAAPAPTAAPAAPSSNKSPSTDASSKSS